MTSDEIRQKAREVIEIAQKHFDEAMDSDDNAPVFDLREEDLIPSLTAFAESLLSGGAAAPSGEAQPFENRADGIELPLRLILDDAIRWNVKESDGAHWEYPECELQALIAAIVPKLTDYLRNLLAGAAPPAASPPECARCGYFTFSAIHSNDTLSGYHKFVPPASSGGQHSVIVTKNAAELLQAASGSGIPAIQQFNYLAVVAGGRGPNVWDKEIQIVAVSVREAAAKIESQLDHDAEILSIERLDESPEPHDDHLMGKAMARANETMHMLQAVDSIRPEGSGTPAETCEVCPEPKGCEEAGQC